MPWVVRRSPVTAMLRHLQENVPAYRIWLPECPRLQGKGRAAYCAALKQGALEQIAAPITSNDVEIGLLYATQARDGVRADVDNILKPTLDALKNAAYVDDRQVRAVSSRLFTEMPNPVVFDGPGGIDLTETFLKSSHDHFVIVSIFSDTRLIELGGTDVVRDRLRTEDKERLRRWRSGA
jgi:hypothetical protein